MSGVRRLVGRVHTAAALERSEGFRRQAVAVLERRVSEVRSRWDLCIAGDLFPRRNGWSVAGDDNERDEDDKNAPPTGRDDGSEDEGWRPTLAVNPVMAVTAPAVTNVPAVVVNLCHSTSPVLQARVLELARR